MSRISVPEKPIPSRHLDQWEKEREYKRHRNAIRSAKAQVNSHRGKRVRKSRKRAAIAKKEFEDNNVDMANEMFIERVTGATSYKHSTLLEEANLSGRMQSPKGASKELKMDKMTVVVPRFGRPKNYSYDGIAGEEEDYAEGGEHHGKWQDENAGSDGYEYEYEECESESEDGSERSTGSRQSRVRRRRGQRGDGDVSESASEAGAARDEDESESQGGGNGRGRAGEAGREEGGDVEGEAGSEERGGGGAGAAKTAQAANGDERDVGESAGAEQAKAEEAAQKKSSKCCLIL